MFSADYGTQKCLQGTDPPEVPLPIAPMGRAGFTVCTPAWTENTDRAEGSPGEALLSIILAMLSCAHVSELLCSDLRESKTQTRSIHTAGLTHFD